MRYRYQLIIDPEFESLVPPLSQEEYSQLEANILRDGCRDPITIWDNVILDGHNRYKICRQHDILFNVNPILIENRDEAISWICSNQMGRRNLTDERRRYLIGKRHEAEKRLGAMNPEGHNQYSEVRPEMWVEPPAESSSRKTSRKLGREYHLSPSTVEKYSKYSKAIDRISAVDREFSDQILSGDMRVSCENTLGIAQLSDKQIQTVTVATRERNIHYLDRDIIVQTIRHLPAEPSAPDPTPRKVSVKDMPEDDPDAGISSLALTIPFWRSTIERVRQSFDFQGASPQAKTRLAQELNRLKHTIDEIVGRIEHG